MQLAKFDPKAYIKSFCYMLLDQSPIGLQNFNNLTGIRLWTSCTREVIAVKWVTINMQLQLRGLKKSRLEKDLNKPLISVIVLHTALNSKHLELIKCKFSFVPCIRWMKTKLIYKWKTVLELHNSEMYCKSWSERQLQWNE